MGFIGASDFDASAQAPPGRRQAQLTPHRSQVWLWQAEGYRRCGRPRRIARPSCAKPAILSASSIKPGGVRPGG